MYNLLLFTSIFIAGEVTVNFTWFRYLKSYFHFEEMAISSKPIGTRPTGNKKFLFLNLSTFKGIMERFIMTVGLILGFSSILIVFGTIKLGTRFKNDQEVKNDYFLIGNFSSILISIFYCLLFKKVGQL